MKKITTLLFLFLGVFAFSQVQTGTFTYSPVNFTATDEVTLTVSGVDPTIWNSGEPDNIFLWTWIFDQCGDEVGGPLIGNGDWNNSNDNLQLTNNGDGTYSFTFTPISFYGTSNISEIGMLVKANDGSGDKKTQDHKEYIGDGIVVNITNPSTNTVVLNSGNNLNLSANILKEGSTTTGNFEVFFNEVLITTGFGTPGFGTILNNITTSGTVRVQGTPSGSDSGSCSFEVLVSPTVPSASLPSGLEDGINYNTSDHTKATLVLTAPLKDFIYVAGSFNNYNPDSSYLMKKDPSSGKFWLELTGLTPGQVETYQYWVYAINPIANSPAIVKTADPFSTLVLSPFDDPWISETTFPGLSTTYAYPSGQEREVSVLQTNQAEYNWQVTNFTKPVKEDLIIYEVLIRDFDSDRNFQDLIDKIDYFKNLNINAIELLPIMEFEGNESWGYNTSFHLALDKFYGTENKLKEFIDLCHQNGIAVILDVALNHAFGRNPMNRMWMNDDDNDGWGEPSSENPYMNQVATHSYSVGSDFNHQSAYTQYYVERVIERWIEDFKIDGFRWDLTKGFTQNATGSDSQTNAYQADRVAILKQYADYSWAIDPDHYVIFEHLGGDTEEQEWANYRLGEDKGIMMWSEMFSDYKNLAQGLSSGINLSRIGHTAHSGFTGKRVVGYPESHDKDRLMYEMVTYGQSGIAGNLNASLNRMSAIGSVFLTVPGPKMLWHFAELGMDDSIFTCSNGTVNTDYDAAQGDCKLDTKPQPQWSENWLNDANRSAVYNDWARLIELKINEPVFEGDYTINTNSQTPKIYIWDDTLPSTSLKNIVIISNFTTSTQNVNPNFPYGGTWIDLMDESGSTTISGSTTSVSLNPGDFRIFGNAAPSLSSGELVIQDTFKLFPNPTSNSFAINQDVKNVALFDLTGKLVKEFNGDFSNGANFSISELTNGIYIVKIINDLGDQHVSKLIKF